MRTLRSHTWRRSAGALAALALIAGACSGDDDDAADTTEPAATDAPAGGATTDAPAAPGGSGDSKLDSVMSSGSLRCGTRNELPGFAVVDSAGDHVGFDADFCRVVAAAVLGDAAAVDFVDLETADRFTALQSGEIDVLIRNTTWTATRDGVEGATFLQTTFFDGQGMMVASDSGFTTMTDLDGVIVCVAQGTTTEGNAAAEAARLGLDWEVRAFDSPDLIQEAFEAGQCDGWSSDVSQLTGLRSAYPGGADALTILPEVFSKEPLGPAVSDGDSAWAQAVEWAILATIQAEEFGITSANIADFADSEDDNIRRFLGQPFGEDQTTLDPGLGLPADFAFQIVSQVGNYAEIFDRHLTPIGLERGVNALWTDGGLMYAPPYR